MRFLAVDLGDKRTGLALGDDETCLVTPVGVVEVAISVRGGAGLLEALEEHVREQLGEPKTPGELVFGLPLNMDGTEGPRARLGREFGVRLSAACGRAVHFQDERLTSVDAEWSLARSGLTRGQKKQKLDALAAAAILRDFLQARKNPG